MDEYLLNLFKQFNEAKGIKYTNFSDSVYIKYFAEWIKEQELVKERYRDFIEYIGVVIDTSYTVELRKGKYDSIALPNTTIISPYASGLGKENMDIVMFQGEPLIIGSNKIIECQVAETYITQNPYSRRQLEGLDYFGGMMAGICLGAYGNLSDKDKEKRIKQIKEYGEIYLPWLQEEYETLDDKYFYLLRSDYKKKKLVKTR